MFIRTWCENHGGVFKGISKNSNKLTNIRVMNIVRAEELTTATASTRSNKKNEERISVKYVREHSFLEKSYIRHQTENDIRRNASIIIKMTFIIYVTRTYLQLS